MKRHSKRRSFFIYYCLSFSQKSIPRKVFLMPFNVHPDVKRHFISETIVKDTSKRSLKAPMTLNEVVFWCPSYCSLCMTPSYHEGRSRWLTELRATEVNILQIRACRTGCIWTAEVLSHQILCTINCPNVLESTRFRHEHTTSEAHEIFAFYKNVNAVYFYSSAEILESVASSRVEFVYEKTWINHQAIADVSQ